MFTKEEIRRQLEALGVQEKLDGTSFYRDIALH